MYLLSAVIKDKLSVELSKFCCIDREEAALLTSGMLIPSSQFSISSSLKFLLEVHDLCMVLKV